MKLYLKQHVFTWGDKFTVYDAAGGDMFYVYGEVFTFGKKLRLCDLSGNELSYIHQRLFSFLPTYYISRGGEDIAKVIKEFTFFRQEYTVEGLGMSVKGDFFAHEYSVYSDGKTLATVSKQWFTWGDAYEIDISEKADMINVLSVILVIDACIEAANNSSNT